MVNSLSAELELRRMEIRDLSTIYFGGGTPSLLDKEDLAALFRVSRQHYNYMPGAEITIEVNPDDVNTDKLASYQEMGINRLSIGVQSFFDEELDYMGRVHNAAEGQEALELAQKMGFDNISIDLIFGLPVLDFERWKENVGMAIETNVHHLSCYQLTVEPKTPLEALIRRQIKSAPDDRMQARQYEYLIEQMEKAGYEHYEISNFAKPGFRSRHNSAYWNAIPYIGIGPSAHSYDGENRQWNIAHNIKYMEAIEAGVLPAEKEILSAQEKYNEFILTRLRLAEGLEKTVLKMYFPGFYNYFINRVVHHERKGWIQQMDDKFCLTRAGKLWADLIASDLMYVNKN